jgi:phenylalanyl-tRNA synthetase alpha chain
MEQQLTALQEKALSAITEAKDSTQIESLRVQFLGKKGELTEILRGLKDLDPALRPKIGELSNQVKEKISEVLNSKKENIEMSEQLSKLSKEKVDITLPGHRQKFGKSHIVSRTLKDLTQIFKEMGYTVATGPDIEDDFHNFEALNMPPNHSARDMWDTFYLESGKLLRTHTSPVQIRIMENQKPPIRVIAPGRVFRKDDDVTHAPAFHQLEGLVIDKNIDFRELKGTLTAFLESYFGKDKKVRFRPSYFPFTEPSAEVDVQCVICNGSGCRVCKHTGWLEILGCGMVDPNVLKAVNIDSEIYTGFAFGLGIERIAMIQYQLNDIRLLTQNDVRFLEQF